MSEERAPYKSKQSSLLQWLREHEHWQSSNDDKRRFAYINKYSEFVKVNKLINSQEEIQEVGK